MTKSNDAPHPSPHENPLSPADVDAIASGLAPLALPPDRARALRQRIMDTVRAVAAEQNGPPLTRTIRAADGEWKTIAPRVHVKLLYKDGEARTYLLRID